MFGSDGLPEDYGNETPFSVQDGNMVGPGPVEVPPQGYNQGNQSATTGHAGRMASPTFSPQSPGPTAYAGSLVDTGAGERLDQMRASAKEFVQTLVGAAKPTVVVAPAAEARMSPWMYLFAGAAVTAAVAGGVYFYSKKSKRKGKK